MNKFGAIRLTSELIRKALKDLDRGKNPCEVLDFINSPMFGEIAEIAGFDHKEIESIRKKIITGEYDRELLWSSRTPYRKNTPNLQVR